MQVKPVRLSSVDVSKVSFPTALKRPTIQHPAASTNAQNHPSYSSPVPSNKPLSLQISERAFPKENVAKQEVPLVQWVQDYASPPPR